MIIDAIFTLVLAFMAPDMDAPFSASFTFANRAECVAARADRIDYAIKVKRITPTTDYYISDCTTIPVIKIVD